MGVPKTTATRWEQEQQYPIPELFVLPKAVSEAVRSHFINARIDEWEDGLARYWAFQENKRADEAKHGKYGWIKFGERYHALPEELCDLGQGEPFQPFSEMLRRLVDGEPKGLHDTGAGLMAYKIRSTVAMHKRARVGTEFHGFMQLPSEIRDMVYSFALPRGTVIVPNNDNSGKPCGNGHVKDWRSHRDNPYERYQGFETNLLAMERSNRERLPLGLIQGVSKTIHDEATRVYFGRNRFILPVGLARRPSYFTSLSMIRSEDPQLTAKYYFQEAEEALNNAVLVRDVSYSFDMREHMVNDWENLCYDDRFKNSVDEGSVSPRDALQTLHDQKLFELEIEWTEKVDCIKMMTLDRLELSFDECYCSLGCCRKVGWILDRFLHVGPPPGTADTQENVYSPHNWTNRPPLVIEVLGWKSEREKSLIQEKLGKLRDSFDSVEIRLGRQAGRQEPQMEADEQFIDKMIEDAIMSGRQ